ncbi:MAG: hypothetical protein E7044_00165 [Lentisphaerae bacterium]|nr:hypothetical protein [Lentisphaerota bacterium]
MTPEDIKHLPFFWSVRRQRYWKQCRRRYFLHYYLARLGRYEESDAVCQEAYELDKRVSAKEYIRIILCKTMHSMFQRCETGSIATAAVLNFKHEVYKMINYPDSVPLIISEIADDRLPDKDFMNNLTEEVRKCGEKIDQNFWLKIQNIPYGYRKKVEHPQPVRFIELGCCFVPVLAFVNHGEMWILESSSVDYSGDLIACIHRMWVYNNLHRDPTKVRSIYLDQNYELKQLDNLPSVSAFLAEIRDDIHNMVEAEMEGFISLRDFPPSPGERCNTCQFFKFCQKRDTFKEILKK